MNLISHSILLKKIYENFVELTAGVSQLNAERDFTDELPTKYCFSPDPSGLAYKAPKPELLGILRLLPNVFLFFSSLLV